jgi:hypothetical protein
MEPREPSNDSNDDPETVNVVIAYRDEDHVEAIENGLAERAQPPRPRRGPIAESAQLLIAGSISIRILANGLIDWGRRGKDTTIFVDARSEPGRIKIYPIKTPHVRRLVFLRRDGEETVWPVDDAPAGVASEIEEFLG